jgi:hypothetical protein
MKSDMPDKVRFPVDQIIGITLIGLLLLSALIYYKSVKAQRYLEPSLAILEPQVAFAQKISDLINEEFGSKQNTGIVFTATSILIDDRLIFTDPYNKESVKPDFVRKLGNILMAMLGDIQMRLHFELILISTRLPISPHHILNKQKQIEKQNNAELVLNALYKVSPGLKNNYALYFTSSVIPVRPEQNENWIEFRFIPSEHLHIDMIKSLKKYSF